MGQMVLGSSLWQPGKRSTLIQGENDKHDVVGPLTYTLERKRERVSECMYARRPHRLSCCEQGAKEGETGRENFVPVTRTLQVRL